MKAARLLPTLCLSFLLVLAPAARARAAADAPLIPRSEMLTVDEIRPGMKGIGKTVFHGTKIEDFGITVLGVLRRVDFDLDLILVSIDSGPPVSRGYGVVSGMSGSPIYIDGKLIGALAYTWTFSKRPVAGVTPIAQMLEGYRPGSSPARRQGTLRPTTPLLLDGVRIERAVVSPQPAPPASANSGVLSLVPVATPVLVSGIGLGPMSRLRSVLEPLGLTPLAGAGAVDHIDAHIEAGAAVGARLMGGDLDLTAIGTVTYVKGDVVLAFGHGVAGLGTTEVPLVAAQVHSVLPSAMLSTKLASAGQTLGTFSEDRLWCLGGRLRAKPSLIPAVVKLTDQDRAVARRYAFEVVRSRTLTSPLLTSVIGDAIDSFSPAPEGTTKIRVAVEAEGLPPLIRENTFAGDSGLGLLAFLLGSGGASSATQEVSQILDALQENEFGEAKVTDVSVEVGLSKRRRTARIEEVYIARQSVRPGDEVDVRVTLRVTGEGRVTRVQRFRVPDSCPPGRLRVGIAGGRSAESLRMRLRISDPTPQSLAQKLEQMLARPSNDDLVVDLALPTVGIEARGYAFRDLPPAVIDVLRSATATHLRPLRDHAEQRTKSDWVVSGQVVLSLLVEGDQKDKAGGAPGPESDSSVLDEGLPGLGDVLSVLELSASSFSWRPQAAGRGEEDSVNTEAPPKMPEWDEVQAVGESEVTTPAMEGEPPQTLPARGEAVGRLAPIWRLRDQKDFAAGKAEGVSLLADGGVELAPAAAVVAQVASNCIWPVAVACDGSVYVGSWEDGALRKLAGGETTVVLETKDAAIQAVAAAPDGAIYAAAIPSCTIYRIAPGAKPQEICRLDAQVVWALAVDRASNLWAATGPQGKLYRVGPDGSVTLAFTAADRHITALVVAPDGTVYLATSPLGKVYAIGPEGRVRSVCEIEKAAAQSIGVDAQGNIYVGTSPDARVLRIDAHGSVRELLKLKGKHVLALHVTADGRVYAAAGPQAEVFTIDARGKAAKLYDPKTAFVAAMATGPSGALYLTAADTGRVVKLDTASRTSGRYTSPVHDAAAAAHWGAVRWQGNLPSGAAVRIFTRTGDTAYPDATWSDWAAVAPAPGATVNSPPARFLQFRLDLEGTPTAPPRVDAIEITYLPANRAPEVSLIDPKGTEVWSGKKTIRWSGKDPDGDLIDYEVYWSTDQGKTWTKIEKPAEPEKAEEPEAAEAASDEEAQKGEASAAGRTKASGRSSSARARAKPPVGIRAQAGSDFEFDPEDLDDGAIEDMLAEAAASKVGEESREKPEEKPARPSATKLEWDTTGGPDGVYRLKVVASDRRSNPADPREAEVISRSFVVDNTPPQVIVDRTRADDSPPPGSVVVFDAGSYVTSAEFRIDNGDWLAAIPGDGIFDGQYEVVLLDGSRLPEGQHTLDIRARDAAGNTATATLRYAKVAGGPTPSS